MTHDELLTPSEVAARCKVSVKTVLRAIRSGALRASQLGGRYAYRVRAEDVDAWLDSTTVRGASRGAATSVDVTLMQRSASQSNRLVLTEEMGRRR